MAHGELQGDNNLNIEELQARSWRLNEETLQSTRHMVSICHESEEAGAKTVGQLGSQG